MLDPSNPIVLHDPLTFLEGQTGPTQLLLYGAPRTTSGRYTRFTHPPGRK